jgi:hypothetical protein
MIMLRGSAGHGWGSPVVVAPPRRGGVAAITRRASGDRGDPGGNADAPAVRRLAPQPCSIAPDMARVLACSIAPVQVVWPSSVSWRRWSDQMFDFVGERGGARTHDPVIKSHVLYRLSYALALQGKTGRTVVPDLVTPARRQQASVRATGWVAVKPRPQAVMCCRPRCVGGAPFPVNRRARKTTAGRDRDRRVLKAAPSRIIPSRLTPCRAWPRWPPAARRGRRARERRPGAARSVRRRGPRCSARIRMN